jgi:hypothetical protein
VTTTTVFKFSNGQRVSTPDFDDDNLITGTILDATDDPSRIISHATRKRGGPWYFVGLELNGDPDDILYEWDAESELTAVP